MNKRPAINIMQVSCDGPFGKVRVWYQQFYNPRANADAYQRRVAGREIRVGDHRPEGARTIAEMV